MKSENNEDLSASATEKAGKAVKGRLRLKKAKSIGSDFSFRSVLKNALYVFAFILLMGSFYTLKDDQYAVVSTLGNPHTVEGRGLKFKLPLIQKVTKVSRAIQGFPLGYRTNSDEYYEDESLMITVDYNFVNVDFYVEYRITDPMKYLYNSEDPVGILKLLCQSYIRDTVGLFPVDAVITTGKSEIQASIREKVTDRMAREDIGIQLVNITMQDSEPPTFAVQQAFMNVETAKQNAETVVNEAKKSSNKVLPAAKADADEIVKKAEAFKQSRINEAEGQTARFNAMFEEYSRFPLITRERLFYESMEEILPNMKIYIINEETGVTSSLPLDKYA